MGKIADNHADKIYLTDDNPRLESPDKIRKDKERHQKEKIIEISNRAKAIFQAIQNLNTGDILLVAVKDMKKLKILEIKKFIFQIKIILNAIKIKNSNLSKNLKLNIIKETLLLKNYLLILI